MFAELRVHKLWHTLALDLPHSDTQTIVLTQPCSTLRSLRDLYFSGREFKALASNLRVLISWRPRNVEKLDVAS
jgi:hypothetical protein